MKTLKKIIEKFRLGDYAVYPLVFSSEDKNHPDKGCLKLVSCRLLGGRWHDYYHYENMKTWEDVFEYYLKEIERLEALVNADTEEERRLIYEEINGAGIKIIGLDKCDLMEITNAGILKSLITVTDIAKDSPKWKKEFWLPILAAWEFSLSKLLTFKKTNQLLELSN